MRNLPFIGSISVSLVCLVWVYLGWQWFVAVCSPCRASGLAEWASGLVEVP